MVTHSADTVALIAVEELESEALTGPWRRLAEERSNPFLTPEWMSAWLRSHPLEEPFALAWQPGGELRGVLPLVRIRRGPLRLLRFPGARRADWLGPACAPADEVEMGAACAAFLAGRRGWHTLRVDRLAEDSSWPAALTQGSTSRLAVGPERRRDVLPYLRFDERGFEGYMADRSRNFRSQLGRRRRRLESDHGLIFRMTERVDDLPADLDQFFRLHDARWDSRGGSSSRDPAAREHIRLFARDTLERGWLRLWLAEADGAPAAAWYGWRIGERYCYALAGLDPSYEQLGLGNVLLAHTIEEAAKEKVAIYDMMWGDEAYKRRFETDRRYASTWILTKRRHPMRLAVASGNRLARAADRLPPARRKRLSAAVGAVRRS